MVVTLIKHVGSALRGIHKKGFAERLYGNLETGSAQIIRWRFSVARFRPKTRLKLAGPTLDDVIAK